jgi:hypothetical protein
MKALYKYPLAEFPYEKLVEENRRRGRHEREFELLDSGRLRPGLRRRVRGVRQGCPRRRAAASHAREPARRSRPRSTCFRRCGSATPGPGAGAGEGFPGAPAPRASRPVPRDGRARDAGSLPLGRGARAGRLAARAALHGERDERRSPVRRLAGRARDEGRVPRVRGARRPGRAERRRRRHQGGLPLSVDAAARRSGDVVAAPQRGGTRARASVRARLLAGLRGAAARGRRLPCGPASRARRRARAAGGATGLRGVAVVEAVLLLRGEGLARGRPPAAASAAAARPAGATRSGRCCSTATWSRCRTSGSTRGTPRGTWRST